MIGKDILIRELESVALGARESDKPNEDLEDLIERLNATENVSQSQLAEDLRSINMNLFAEKVATGYYDNRVAQGELLKAQEKAEKAAKKH